MICNEFSVEITKTIINSLTSIALIVAVTILLIKIIDILATSCADWRKHWHSIEDSKNKQKSLLLSMKLNNLKDDKLIEAIDAELAKSK